MFFTPFGFFELGIVLLLTVVLPVAVVVALVLIMARSRQSSPATPPGTPTLVERSVTLRKKNDHYREERSRILGMVDAGTISPEDAYRLLETLERETTTMACPFCGEDIRAEARKCKHCRQYLVEEMHQPRRLTKSPDKVLAGVCGGLANTFGLDPALVRVLTALTIFFTGILTGLLIYLVAALVIPAE